MNKMENLYHQNKNLFIKETNDKPGYDKKPNDIVVLHQV